MDDLLKSKTGSVCRREKNAISFAAMWVCHEEVLEIVQRKTFATFDTLLKKVLGIRWSNRKIPNIEQLLPLGVSSDCAIIAHVSRLALI